MKTNSITQTFVGGWSGMQFIRSSSFTTGQLAESVVSPVPESGIIPKANIKWPSERFTITGIRDYHSSQYFLIHELHYWLGFMLMSLKCMHSLYKASFCSCCLSVFTSMYACIISIMSCETVHTGARSLIPPLDWKLTKVGTGTY